MKIKLNKLEEKQKYMHRDLLKIIEQLAKLLDSSMKLIDTKLEMKVNILHIA